MEFTPEGFRLSLKLPNQQNDTADAANHASLTFSRFIPMQIKRRGVELRLVIGGIEGRMQKADPALLKAVARAHRWFDDLVSGRVKSMAEIATREGVQKSYVSQLISLAFLAPDIVEAIARGNHPPDLTAQALITRKVDLPVDWQAQKTALQI